MLKSNLLQKTELKIDPICLQSANLTDIAAAAADVLGLSAEEVLVVDYQQRVLVLDILNTCVNAYRIVGQKAALLKSLSALPGVSITDETSVYSNGMLAWIALDERTAVEGLKNSEQTISEIRQNIAKRAAVFSSGAEVQNQEIEDTNTPTIKAHLEACGFKVSRAGVLPDDRDLITARLREASELGGYGIIITTGGVGAEQKDQTVEAIQDLDPDAATPYICRFEIGTGRHVKDGVRIAVGCFRDTTLIALPGPNDEVLASLGPMTDGLKKNAAKQMIAEMIAANLRQILSRKMNTRKGSWSHEGGQLHIPHQRN